MHEDDFLVGVRMFSGENNGIHIDSIDVTFLITDEIGFKAIEQNSSEYKIRKVSVDMDIGDFLALFKRLEVTLSSNSCLEGKEY